MASAGERARARWPTVLRAFVLALGALHVGFVAFAVVQRFRYPVELEWMSGGVLDHVERVAAGEAIYVPPSVRFIPFLYPPLFYWLSALLSKAMTIQAACRVVSTTATVLTAVLVHGNARALGATRYWALVGTALFVSAYSLTGYWYDLERSDTLLMAMLTGGLLVALRVPGVVGAAIAGALVAGAFLAKQPASIFFAAGLLGFALARSVERALAFAAGGLVVLLPLLGWLTASTDGWFWYYCVKMPASHGIDSKLFTIFFVLDATKAFLFSAATVALLAAFASRAVASLRSGAPLDEKTALFGAMLAAGLFTSATSRLHVGGYLNVLIFWITFAAIGFAVLASRLAARKDASARTLELVLLAGAALQLGHLLYDPAEAAPDERRVRDQGLVAARVRELGAAGEVLVPGRGHLTEPRGFHAIALMDVLRGGLPLPDDLVRGLDEQRFAAYVVDELGELTLEPIIGRRSELADLVYRNYFIAQRLDDREPPPLVGWIAHPSWVLRPRRTRLTGMTSAALDRRIRIEMGVAEMRMRAVQAGARGVDDGAEVETLAAAIDGERAAR